ncbi:hypothetical protein [Sorangium sp. So ce1000]|uniref:hypothetical protein n=1 Tax=Sorangium sp. So ce1000 TaxID=3133325 RepID=UPI003F64847B
MRVRLGRENRGFYVTKLLELLEAGVWLAEDAGNMAVQVDPAVHLAHIDRMEADGWDVENKGSYARGSCTRSTVKATRGPLLKIKHYRKNSTRGCR